MPRVLCELPNASTEINGVAFAAVEGGMLSIELSEEAAANFASINGYRLYEAPVAAPAAVAETEAAEPEVQPRATKRRT